MKKVLLNILILAVALGSFLSPISAAVNNDWTLVLQKNQALAADNFYFAYYEADSTKVVVSSGAPQQADCIAQRRNVLLAEKNKQTPYEWPWWLSGKITDCLLKPAPTFQASDYTQILKDAYDALGPQERWWFIGANEQTLPVGDGSTTTQTTFKVFGSFPSEPVCKTEETKYADKSLGLSIHTPCAKADTAPVAPDKTITAPTAPSYSPGDSTKIVFEPDNLPECGVVFSGTLYGCIIQVFYYAFWMPTNFLAYYAGKLLDFFIFYSIDSASYDKSGFINEGWKVVRDIANIAFIFVLLYIALRTILNLGGSDSKKMITWVVVIALLINFSLFFTKVIVDSGNIVAGVLYNQIGSLVKTKDVGGSEKEISAGLVDQFNPQTIMFQAGVETQAQAEAVKTPYLVMIVMATIVNVFMLTTFLSVALLFVGRVVGLMFSMIFSPFAFMSLTIPGSSGFLKQWSWSKWLPELLSVTFMAPIFIFFLWLIIAFQKVGWLDTLKNFTVSGNTLGNVISVLLPFVLILALLNKAKEVAKSMAGEVAGKLADLAGKGVGLLGGVALGGAALLGRATIGRLAAGRLEGAGGEALRERAARGDVFARTQLQTFQGLASSSLDVRKTRAVAALQKETGINVETTGFRVPLTNIDLKTEGGYRGAIEREKKRQEGISNLFKQTGPEADDQNARSKAWQKKYDDEEAKAEGAAFNAGVIFNKGDFRKMYEGGNAAIKDQAGKVIYENKTGTPKVANASETNAKRMKDQADSLEYGNSYVAYRDEQIKTIQKRAADKLAKGQALTAADKYDENEVKNAFLAQTQEYTRARDAAKVKLGTAFNENTWREEEYFRNKVSRTDQETISDLRKKAGEEDKKEKPSSPKEKAIAQKTLQRTTDKLNTISQHLQDIADEYNRANPGANKAPGDVGPSELKISLQKKETDLIVKEVTLMAAQKALKADPANPARITDFTNAKMAVNTHKQAINDYKNLFNDKERTEKEISEANRVISS